MKVKNIWHNPNSIQSKSYDCGHCGAKVGPSTGYSAKDIHGRFSYIYICPNCTHPTYVSDVVGQIPSSAYGNEVEGISNQSVKSLYDEARNSYKVGAFTASVMISRKILMNLAVQHGASENLKFVEYVDFLSSNGWVPPNGKTWVDQIRQKGNEANHEIALMSKGDAQQILKFVEMLLKFMFEMVNS